MHAPRSRHPQPGTAARAPLPNASERRAPEGGSDRARSPRELSLFRGIGISAVAAAAGVSRAPAAARPRVGATSRAVDATD